MVGDDDDPVADEAVLNALPRDDPHNGQLAKYPPGPDALALPLVAVVLLELEVVIVAAVLVWDAELLDVLLLIGESTL